MFENPAFVEDIVRNVTEFSRKELYNGHMKVKVINFESIHRHNVISENEVDL